MRSPLQHTPGPWRIGTPPPNGERTIGTHQGLMVAVATTGAGIPTEANARLIAAAPDLLEALRIARDHIDMTALEISHRKDADIIRAAIARALSTQGVET